MSKLVFYETYGPGFFLVPGSMEYPARIFFKRALSNKFFQSFEIVNGEISSKPHNEECLQNLRIEPISITEISKFGIVPDTFLDPLYCD